ncbi:Gp49 family protein [Gottfriedia acidiceleris]|uniref:Gp49 family protein n=1 Tax=Gottfriedia acidiceleris TaxID=371036 RepID=UPI00339644FF
MDLIYERYEQHLIEHWVKSQEATRLGVKTTVVCITMNNGFEVIGQSACVNPEQYDYELGVYYATKEALKRVADIVAYLEHEATF